MTKRKEHTQNLADLLKSKSTGKQDAADEFEKAALEGFSSLTNEEEAFALKNELDTELYATVFKPEKQASKRMYWLAAAGFAGIVGISIYFFQSYAEVKQNKLAQQIPIEEKPKLSPEKNKISTEESLPQPAEQKVAPPKTVTTEIKHLGKSELSEPVKSDEATVMQEDASPSAAASNAAPAVSAAMEPAYEKQPQKITEEAETKNNREDLAVAAPVEKSRASATKPETKKSKESEKEVISDEESPDETQQLKSVTFSTAKAASCYYEGGDPALNKELREKLKTQHLNRQFDAVLFLNKKAQVVKVKLEEVNEFSFEEQQQLTEILKSLSKFKVEGLSGNKKLIEYKIAFRP